MLLPLQRVLGVEIYGTDVTQQVTGLTRSPDCSSSDSVLTCSAGSSSRHELLACVFGHDESLRLLPDGSVQCEPELFSCCGGLVVDGTAGSCCGKHTNGTFQTHRGLISAKDSSLQWTHLWLDSWQRHFSALRTLRGHKDHRNVSFYFVLLLCVMMWVCALPICELVPDGERTAGVA